MSALNLIGQVSSLIPSLVKVSDTPTYKGKCPFHSSQLPSLVVQPGLDTVFCLSCHYGGSVEALLEDLKRQGPHTETPAPGGLDQTTIYQAPMDSYGHLLSEEVSYAIHHHFFMNKVKQLNQAVDHLAKLISKMKFRIDPAK